MATKNKRPVTTDARPVFAPSDTPAELSTKVVVVANHLNLNLKLMAIEPLFLGKIMELHLGMFWLQPKSILLMR